MSIRESSRETVSYSDIRVTMAGRSFSEVSQDLIH